MKRIYLLVSITTLAVSGFASAANNQGGAGSLNQMPAVSSTQSTAPTNPAAPAASGNAAAGGNLNTGSTPVPGGSAAATVTRPSGPSNPATEMQRSTMTEIAFAPGQAELSAETKAKVDLFMREARRRGVIEQVKVLSWGDAGYPAKEKELTASEKELANRRAQILQEYISGRNNGLRVQRYNMAERPTALEELLNSSESRIKQSLVNAGLAGPEAQKGSRAMVMVIVR